MQSSHGPVDSPSLSEPAQDERRSQTRHPVDLRISCKSVDLTTRAPWSGECRDLSQFGVRLVMSRRFEPRTLLLIELQDDEHCLVRSLMARVVWTEKDPCQRWHIGCTLLHELHEEDLASLRRECRNTAVIEQDEDVQPNQGSEEIDLFDPKVLASPAPLGGSVAPDTPTPLPVNVERLRQRLRQRSPGPQS
jgi:hypothetical protein